jgi:hypothetical protein
VATEVSYAFFEGSNTRNNPNLETARKTAKEVRSFLESPEIQLLISKAHVFHASSHSIQSVILPEMLKLGFSSEKKGLFSDYKVSGIRPDFYLDVQGGGILFEVERGKTIANNMDLLDVWKTHLCKEARHLFLLVPKIRVTEKGTQQKIFQTVVNRVETFFLPNQNPIDVDSVHIYGY